MATRRKLASVFVFFVVSTHTCEGFRKAPFQESFDLRFRRGYTRLSSSFTYSAQWHGDVAFPEKVTFPRVTAFVLPPRPFPSFLSAFFCSCKIRK